MGGDLSPERILSAYRQGIFPWYSEEQPILWWSPDPRTVLFPKDLMISKSLRKKLRAGKLRITFDQAFAEVIHQCALPRRDESGTWISPEIIQAYCQLHEQGHAHSVEAWNGDALVGGLYGIAINRVFFGESMFSRESDASKIAFSYLVQQLNAWGIELIDCQVYTAHLESLGAQEITRDEFITLLPSLCDTPIEADAWIVQPSFSSDYW